MQKIFTIIAKKKIICAFSFVLALIWNAQILFVAVFALLNARNVFFEKMWLVYALEAINVP